ncbi:hypothetical protein J3T91_05700 [Bifidobacterium sp. B4001]|uniref:hypothetical protein n=1 Tax=unclassified Bifidobacterium TaxID=2608897 RepID=UPI00226B3617|nr:MULTISPECIES: hypothetical protein [unclassified Bifidobacterium]MCX8673007.1 hypothetical protein [Bifidobacterium sp. B4079]MCX8681440.1 hypothetical protein [Bifidobacterium sp. B4001]
MRGLKPFNPLSLALAKERQEKQKQHRPEDDLDEQARTELDAIASRITPGG